MEFKYKIDKNGKAVITRYFGKTSKNITIPSTIDGIPVTSIGAYAFSWCTSLESVIIPNGVTRISSSAFYYCTSLANITIPDSITSIGCTAFYNTGIYNEPSNWENDVLYIGNYLIKAETSISRSYIIKNGTKLVADYAFYDCTNLKGVTIPDSVTSIGDGAFAYCKKLKRIIIPDSIASIGNGILNECANLKSITIPDSVTSIGDYAFFECDSLESITIPDSVTSIGNNAFHRCVNLKSKRANYKAFDLKSGKLYCRDYEFSENEWSEQIDDILMCNSGYHFCTNLFEIFNYYDGRLDEDGGIAIYECEVGDKVLTSNNSKCVTNTIKPVKRLSRKEIISILNGEQ